MTLEEKNIPEGSGNNVTPELKTNIEQRLQKGLLPCAQAFTLAKQQDIEPAEVGKAADALQIRLGRCQLGLFGYPGKQGWKASGVMDQEYPPELETAIKSKAGTENHINCKAAWDLAKEYGISRMHIGYIIDNLGVRIVGCQLGAF